MDTESTSGFLSQSYLESLGSPFFNSFCNSAVDPTNNALLTVDGHFTFVSYSTSFNFF